MISTFLSRIKDKVYRILKRIMKGDIEITEKGEVIDKSKLKGIVTYQKMTKQTFKAQIAFPESIERVKTQTEQLEPLAHALICQS